jgi:hypothetical protein
MTGNLIPDRDTLNVRFWIKKSERKLRNLDRPIKSFFLLQRPKSRQKHKI